MTSMEKSYDTSELTSLETLSKIVAQRGKAPFVITLSGDLGAGKTTFTQMYLKELGVTGVVKSPTYTFVEEYELNDIYVYHFDLYRLSDPDELEFLGFDDYRVDNSILVIEWPERAAGYIRDIDLEIKIEFMGERRVATILSRTNKGETVIECL